MQTPEKRPDAEIKAAREALVDRFNTLIGLPLGDVEEMQRKFVNGELDLEESVSYERYCRYMLSTQR
jgi:hypothetical protein